MEKIADVLHELQDFLPKKFTKMKGISGELGEMKIPLNPDVKRVKQPPYRLNLWYTEWVKVELKYMIDDGIIKIVEESCWIIPMVL